MAYRYFSESEFRRATPSCSLSQMDSDFMDRLEYARSMSDCPFIVNSAYRSFEYEISHGRSGSSSHTKGLAVDLHCSSDRARCTIIKCLMRAGFRRIGIAKTFIHVDSDKSKNDSIWLYDK